MNHLLLIQKWMIKNKKDVFLINRTDEFLNEYIASYAERLKWISNFSGSAGRAIIEIVGPLQDSDTAGDIHQVWKV